MQATGSRSRTGAVLSATPRAAPGFSRLTRVKRWVRRITFLVHRWLGIALGLLMAVWAVSGIVMMYVAFPETTQEERLAGLDQLDLSACCQDALLPGGAQIGRAQVEMVAGEPVLRWAGPGGPGAVSLARAALPGIGVEQAGSIAATHMRNAFGTSPAMQVEQIGRDQWTVYGRFRQYAPLYKVGFADERGTVLYVSGATGEVVQDTSRHERFWNWLGAVPHWLYFTFIREVQPLWYNFVVYASLLGTFLTATGLYIGISMWGRGKRKSPYRGLAAWHHWTGLIFGVLTLTWVASGLLSMNPWGWLESEGPGEEMAALAGRPLEPSDATALFTALAANPRPGVVSADATVQEGQAYALLARADGSRQRATLPGLAPAPLTPADLAAKAAIARPGVPIASAGLIHAADAYYYAHKGARLVLPAYRVIYGDEAETRLYFDPRTGELVGYADPASRAYRWLHYGLHRLDFGAVLRSRPVWDVVVLPLMIGVSLLCVIGTWLGFRRLRRDLKGARR